jgi:hypothetical protein
MGCTVTIAGRALPCSDSLGGIKNVWLAPYAAGTYTAASSGGVGHAVATTYKNYVPQRNSSSMTQTITASRENGTVFYSQVVTLVMSKLTAAELTDLQQLIAGRVHCIVEDMNGNKMVLGLAHGVEAQGGSIATGTAGGDLNGISLELIAEENLPAQFYETADDGVGLTISFTPST